MRASSSRHAAAKRLDGRIALLNDEGHLPYQRPPLSKASILKGIEAARDPDVPAGKILSGPAHRIDSRSRGFDRPRRAQGCISVRRAGSVMATSCWVIRCAQPAARHSQCQSGSGALFAYPRREVGRCGIGSKPDSASSWSAPDSSGWNSPPLRGPKALEVDVIELGVRVMARAGHRRDLGILSGCKYTAAGTGHPSRRAGHRHRERWRQGHLAVSLNDGRHIARPTSWWSASASCPMSRSRRKPVCRWLPGIVVNDHLLTADHNIFRDRRLCALYPATASAARCGWSPQNATDHACCVAARG